MPAQWGCSLASLVLADGFGKFGAEPVNVRDLPTAAAAYAWDLAGAVVVVESD
jgi:hypothetical protein